MKENIIILSISAIITLSIAFYLFNFNPSLVGYAIYEVNQSTNINLTTSIITKDIALVALNDSQQVIDEMIKNNFSITFANDTLIEARRMFEQARYADILRGSINATPKERLEAIQALKIVNWKNINYSNVIEYTNKINERLPLAFSIYDGLKVIEKRMNDERISDKTKDIYEKAKTAFYEDRYDDAAKLIEDAKASIEKDLSENSGLIGLRRNALNFFQRYWFAILIAIIILSIIIYFSYNQIQIRILKNKITKMKAEKIAISQLIIKNQTERFKENKISEMIYNIRDKKYKSKLQEIEEELPVLEAKLRKDIKNAKNNK